MHLDDALDPSIALARKIDVRFSGLVAEITGAATRTPPTEEIAATRAWLDALDIEATGRPEPGILPGGERADRARRPAQASAQS